MSPEQPQQPLPDADVPRQELLTARDRYFIYNTGLIDAAAVAYLIQPKDLTRRGFGPSFFEIESFGEGAKAHTDRLKALFEITRKYKRSFEPRLVGHLSDDAIRDESVPPDEVEPTVLFIKAVAKTTNYYERLKAASGNAEVFTAQEDQVRGGVIETDENDRLSIEHLEAIVKEYPEVSDVIAALDKKYADKFLKDDQQDNVVEWKHPSVEDALKDIKLNLEGDNNGQKEAAIKYLARAWYELLGMPELRAYQHRNEILTKYMPNIEKYGTSSKFRDKYFALGEKFDWVSYYKGISTGYNSSFGFEIDVVLLVQGILKNSKPILEELKSVVRHTDDSKAHNTFNLGWMPAGYALLCAINGNPQSLNISELHNLSFEKKQLKSLAPIEWKAIKKDVDYQKIMVTNLLKVDKAKVAFIQFVTTGKPEFIEQLFVAVAGYVRSSKDNTKTVNDPWNRSEILPMLSAVVLKVLGSYMRAGADKMDRSVMKSILARIKEIYSPDIVFTNDQEQILVGKDSQITKDFTLAAISPK